MFLVAIGWAALWVNVVVIPFFFKAEKLQKDYLDSGAIGVAVSYIESNKLIPVLAGMFKRARESQDDQRKRIDMEELLQAVDFLPDLEQVESALREKKAIEDTFDTLQRAADRLWKLGISHVVAVVLVPVFLFFEGSFRFYPDFVLFVLIAAAILTFTILLVELLDFAKQRKMFLNILKANR